MRQAFTMPKLGLTMAEGALVEWSVQPGDRFVKDQCIFIVETDKAANEIGAEADGVMLEAVQAAGVTVPVGTVLGYWDDGVAGGGSGGDVPVPQTPVAAASAQPGERLLATPLARRMASLRGIDLAQVRGSGPRGRIKAADVESASAATPAPATAAPPAVPSQAEGRIATSGVQAAMARRLTAAKQEVPHFYLAREADVGRLMALRAELNEAGGHRFTLNHFIVAALGRALVDFPQANRVWQGKGLVQLEGSDVGIAVNTQKGLFVPVLREAGRLPMSELAQRARSAVERARAGHLTAPEMSGGALTVSNAGMHDVTYMTPIINPGQAMILGVGSVRQVFRPDAQRQPALRSEMGLVLACDHRVLDGVSGLGFLGRVVAYLEQPLGLLIGT